jgi:hypothetical protein
VTRPMPRPVCGLTMASVVVTKSWMPCEEFPIAASLVCWTYCTAAEVTQSMFARLDLTVGCFG